GHHRGHGAIRSRDGHRVAPHERDGDPRAGARVSPDTVRTEVRDPGAADLSVRAERTGRSSMMKRWQWVVAGAALVLLLAGTSGGQAPEEVRVGDQPNPIQDASIALM